ncbi:unnamed protein product [Ostreobium quekettii]|uniref:Protein kinase domain-containing protein n=1 Tax=Ostreobium quekettii TaxID=121088 RepID=A0A8S1JBM0_9CHLO|nr:unnamed protein product [Ostreobium quekettii]
MQSGEFTPGEEMALLITWYSAPMTFICDSPFLLYVQDGSTALIVASKNGHTAIAELLLNNGASLAHADKDGSTALIAASQHNHTSTAELLLRKGASVDFANTVGSTALIITAQNGHTATAQLLLDNGASMDDADEDGSTALIVAAQQNHTSTAELLLRARASVDFANNDGSTALIATAQHGHTATAELLLANGASVYQGDKDGHTPLYHAARGESAAVLPLLKKHGAIGEERPSYNAGIVTFLQKQMIKVERMLDGLHDESAENLKTTLRKALRFIQKHELPFSLKKFYTVADARQAAQGICRELKEKIPFRFTENRDPQDIIQVAIPEPIFIKDTQHLNSMLSYVLEGKQCNNASNGLLHKWEDARGKHVKWSSDWLVPDEAVEVGNVLGQGGQACVHEGRYKDELVAVKKPTSSGQDLPIDKLAALLKEGYLHSELDAKYTPRLFAITKSGWIVMEMADRDLRTLCQEEQDLAWSKKLLLLQKGAFALKYFHSKGIVHSDVKGSNFLVFGSLEDDYVVKLADFGVASDDTFTRSLTVRVGQGTDVCMAPEVYDGAVSTAASDIFALGVVMYEVITGKEAYSVEGRERNRYFLTMMKTQGRQGGKPVEPCAIFARDCPEEMHHLMKMCCSEDLEGRPAVEEVCTQLSEMPKAWVAAGSSVAKLNLIIAEVEEVIKNERVLYNKKMLMFLYQQMDKVQKLEDVSVQKMEERAPEAFESLTETLRLGVKLIRHHANVFACHFWYPIREVKCLVERYCQDFRTSVCKLDCETCTDIECKIPKEDVAEDKKTFVMILKYILEDADPMTEDTCKEWKQVKDSMADLLDKMQPISDEEIPMQDEDFLGDGDDDGVYEAQWEGKNVLVKRQAPASTRLEGLERFGKACSFLALHNCKEHAQIAGVLAITTSGSIVMKGGEADLVKWYKALDSSLSWQSRLHVLWQASTALGKLHDDPIPLVHSGLKTKNFVVDDIESRAPHVILCCLEPMSCREDAQKIEFRQPRRTLYDAPELHRGKPCTVQSDVYSFGVVVWELAVQLPPQQMTSGQLCIRPEKLLSRLPDDCPQGLTSIIKKCLSPEPSKRPRMCELQSQLFALKKQVDRRNVSAV